MNFKKYNKFAEIQIIQTPQGYLVWRYGTADNVELFDIDVVEKRKGYGTELIKMLLEKFKSDPPIMIFGFTRQSNRIAQLFYSKLGFKLLSGVEDHCLFWQLYNKLYATIKLL